MTKPTVLLIGDLAHCNKEWQEYGSKYQLKEFRKGSRSEFLSNCKNGEYDDVVGLYRSNNSVSETGPFDQELVSALPKSLKYICHNGAGYDNVDVDACSSKGLKISSTPIAVDDATADGREMEGETPIGHDPKGKVLGILGMGGIGRAMAHRARAFGMKIIYHNRSRLSKDLEGDAEYVSFDELLAKSDVLSLNLSLNAKTRHIISAPEFKKMKDGVVIVNTARGALMNEKDLVAALDQGKVASVGLDVFENEPKVEEGLLKNERIFIVPHIGTSTYETQREMELLVLHNLEKCGGQRGIIDTNTGAKGKAWESSLGTH